MHICLPAYPQSERAGQFNLSAGSLSTWRVDKGGARHTDIKTDQILFPRRTAVKGNCVAASPPGISTPRKHSEMKGDMEICPDTAVSEHVLYVCLCQALFVCLWLCSVRLLAHAYMQIPTGFHTCTVLFHKPIHSSTTSSALYPPKAHYRFTLCF